MADASEPWEELQPFRETFLLYLDGLDVEPKFRMSAGLLYAMFVEWCQPSSGPSLRVLQLGAVAADLRYIQEYLARTGASDGTSEGDPARDLKLAAKAAKWARAVAKLAAEMEQATVPPVVP